MASKQTQTGTIREWVGASGIVTYTLRIRWRGRKTSVRLGSELEGWNRPLAESKLKETVAQIEAGIWRPPVEDLPAEETDPNFHEFATVWIDRHRIGKATSTEGGYAHVLSGYILPEFKDCRLSEITHELVLRWRDRLLREAEQLKLADEHGVPILDPHGKPKRAFGPATINEALRLLGQILERAVESELYAIERNPVKGRTGLRVKQRKGPPRSHLEADELMSLIQAADIIDQGVSLRSIDRAKTVRELRAHGMPWAQIAEQIGCAETTAIYLSRLEPKRTAARRRRMMIVLLGLTGLRASEFTGIVWGRVDHTHGRLVVGDSKTDEGVREVHLFPFVREELALYRASLPLEPAPSDPVFAVRGGGHGDRFNLGRRLKRIAVLAAQLREADGLAPMPTNVTPHTFRRTFVTLCLQAGKDLPFVQKQVGHKNWKTTLEIYTQQSGRSSDPKIRNLLEQFLGEPSTELITQGSPESVF
jgi:integrase